MANLLKIKEIASRKNISLKEIADYIGITPTALSKIMRENSTKTSTLERIAIKLKVPVSVFFSEENSEVEILERENAPPKNDCDCEKLRQELEDKKELIECLKRENETLREFNATLQRNATKRNKTQSEAKKSA